MTPSSSARVLLPLMLTIIMIVTLGVYVHASPSPYDGITTTSTNSGGYGGGHLLCAATTLPSTGPTLCYIANNSTAICGAGLDVPDATRTALFTSIACGYGMCGLDVEGRIRCMSPIDTEPVQNIPFGAFASVAVHPFTTSVCALRLNGQLVCFSNTLGIRTIPDKRYRVISYGHDWVCGLTLMTNQLDCLLIDTATLPQDWQSYATETTWISFDCSYQHCCGVLSRDGGVPVCFGASHQRTVSDTPTNLRFDHIWVSERINCGRLADTTNHTLVCWGYMRDGEVRVNISSAIIIDMHCDAFTCWFLTTTSDRIVYWPERTDLYDVTVRIDRYQSIYGQQSLTSPICGIQDNGAWRCFRFDISHAACLWYPTNKGLPSQQLSRIQRISADGQVGMTISTDGVLYAWDCSASPVIDLPPEIQAQRFIDICRMRPCFCGVRTNGTLVCWCDYDPGDDRASPPPGDDYVSLHCGKESACAHRRDGTVACWSSNHGDNGLYQPPVDGPFLKIQSLVESVEPDDSDHYYGVYHNHTVYRWGATIAMDSLNISSLMIDFSRTTRSGDADLARNCIIPYDGLAEGQLVCSRESRLSKRTWTYDRTATPLMAFNRSLSVHNQLTADMKGNVCVLMDGQVSCAGGVSTIRMGGYAMTPRHTWNREVHINTYDGVDTLFCGQPPFKSCRTLEYAMSLLENSGIKVTYVFDIPAKGAYGINLATALTINYAGVTIRSSYESSQLLSISCVDMCFIINAPSFHLHGVEIAIASSSAVVINAGLMDVVITSSVFRRSGSSAIQLLPNSYLTLVDTEFFQNSGLGACVYGNGVTVRVSNSYFALNSDSCIYLTDSVLTIANSKFNENRCYTRGCAVFMSGSSSATQLTMYDTVFDGQYCAGHDGAAVRLDGPSTVSTTFTGFMQVHIERCQFLSNAALGDGGAMTIYNGVELWIMASLFYDCRAGRRGGSIAATGGALVTISNSTFNEGGAYSVPNEFMGGAIFAQWATFNISHTVFAYQFIPYRSAMASNLPVSGPSGGAIACKDATLIMRHVHIHHASAHNGGAIAGRLAPQTSIEHCWFDHNKAHYGGVFSLLDVPTSMVIRHTIFSHNECEENGAVWYIDTNQDQSHNWAVPCSQWIIPTLPASLNNTSDDARTLTYVDNYASWSYLDNDVITGSPSWLVLDADTYTYPIQTTGVALRPTIDVQVKNAFGDPFTLRYPEYIGGAIPLISTIRYVPGTSRSMRHLYGREDHKNVSDPIMSGDWTRSDIGRPLTTVGTIISGFDVIIIGEPASIATYEVLMHVAINHQPEGDDFQDITRYLHSEHFQIQLRACVPGENTTETSCDACTPGRYSNVTLATDCPMCSVGRFQALSRGTQCDACDDGKIQSRSGGTTCSSCGAGKYASMEQSICHTCEPGRYSSGSSNGRCDACLSGTVSGDAGLTKCTPCFPGTYAINSTTCVPCPHGWYQSYSGQSSCSKCAIGSAGTAAGNVACAPCGNGYTFEEASVVCIPCTFGLTCENGMVTVSQNYWAYSVNETVHSIPNVRRLLAVPCPKGHCNGGEYTSANFTPCMINRDQSVDNVMCGRCEAGHSQFGAACIPCREVNCGYIMLTMLAIFVVAFGLHISAQGTSGIQATIIYFVQMAMFMLPSTETWLGWISIFSGGSTSVFGICIAPLTPIEQMVFEVSSMMLFMVALAIIFGIHWAMARWIFCGKCQEKLVEQTCIPLARYWRSFVSLYLFSFSTLANTLMGYMLCIDANNDRRIFTSPTLSCNSPFYNRWLPWVAILFIITIVIPPIALVIYLSRNRHRFNDEKFIGRWGQLYEPFSPRAFWWGIMVLFRRLIFTLVDIALVVLPSFKYMIFTMLHLLSLIIHVLVQPYSLASFNRAELFTLMSLTLLGIILSTFPTPAEITQHTEIRVLISFVVLAPILIFSIYAIKVAIEMIRNNCSRIKAIGQQVRDGVINGVDTVGKKVIRKVKKKKTRQPSEHKLLVNDTNNDGNGNDDSDHDNDNDDDNDSIVSHDDQTIPSLSSMVHIPVHHHSSVHGRTSISVHAAPVSSSSSSAFPHSSSRSDLRQPLIN